MRVTSTCTITLPSGREVQMTPEELLKFHDELTDLINKNWETLKEKDDE